MSTGEKTKSYLLHCQNCGWRMFWDGSEDAVKGIYEYQACQNCHGARVFRCQGCGHQVRAKRVVDPPAQPKMERPKPIGHVSGVTDHRPTGQGPWRR